MLYLREETGMDTMFWIVGAVLIALSVCVIMSGINDLIKKKELLLSELNNYKKSLIFEYVTRKKAVVI